MIDRQLDGRRIGGWIDRSLGVIPACLPNCQSATCLGSTRRSRSTTRPSRATSGCARASTACGGSGSSSTRSTPSSSGRWPRRIARWHATPWPRTELVWRLVTPSLPSSHRLHLHCHLHHPNLHSHLKPPPPPPAPTSPSPGAHHRGLEQGVRGARRSTAREVRPQGAGSAQARPPCGPCGPCGRHACSPCPSPSPSPSPSPCPCPC